ncbi:centrosomal protein of 162 kDa-like [Centruroides vittatus]|uniref:centrosomal protein of 162 kDa-like n=1 Tax=Centruroides vittatus TaxID=120091 RepID=UPI00350E96F8
MTVFAVIVSLPLGYEKRMKTVESQYQQQINILEKKLIERGFVRQGNNSVQIFPKTSQSSQCSILDWKRWDYIVAENRDLVMKLEKLKIEIEELRAEYKKVKEEAGRIITETQHETQEMISKMRSEMDDLKMEHEKSEIRARTLIRNSQKESQEMAKQLKTLHVRHLQQAWIENISSAKTYSEDYQKIADLTNKLETKEIIINQLKLKIEEYEEEKDKIKILEMRNSDLEDKLRELNITLNRIISSQNPQQKEISLLKEEIRILDRRHKSREDEIQKLLYKLKQQDSKYLKKEVERWQQRVIDKNKEIEGFREELDVILRFLEELKQQGVVVPRARSAVL